MVHDKLYKTGATSRSWETGKTNVLVLVQPINNTKYSHDANACDQ